MMISFILFLFCLIYSFELSFALDRILIDPETGFFVDELNRVRIFRGVNAVFKQPPFLPQLDGFDPQLSLSAIDAQNLAEWGFNVVRLGVMWVGFEPERGAVNQTFVSDAARLVALLANASIHTIVDQHQDLLNRKLCGEGFPDWAVAYPANAVDAAHRFPFPVAPAFVTGARDYPPLAACLSHGFFEYYVSSAVANAFQALYDNAGGLADAFVRHWAALARALAGRDGVLGFELLNEPFFGNVLAEPRLLVDKRTDRRFLAPLYERLARVVRAADPDALVFFEKATGNYVATRTGLPHVPMGDAYRNRSVYSWHEYCGPRTPQGAPIVKALCDLEQDVWFHDALADAKMLGGGTMMTEFGALSNTSSGAIDLLEKHVEFADKTLLSWAYWQFKSFRDLTTSGGSDEGFYGPDGKLQTNKLSVLVRPYAQIIAGIPISMSFDVSSKDFVLTYRRNVAAVGTTEIYVPEKIHYSNGFTVSVSPAGVAKVSTSHNKVTITHLASFTQLIVAIHAK